MTTSKPDFAAKPLTSQQLGGDLGEAGSDDRASQPGNGTHLPASESDALSKKDRKQADPERDVTLLPPD